MKYLLLIFLCLFSLLCSAQIDWGNYSTSFTERDNIDTTPLLVTAIPYNGIYSNFDDIDTLTGMERLMHLAKNNENNTREFYVYDSNKVHFFAPGIFKNNAYNYEYCVLLNGKKIIQPWSNIDSFTNTSLNEFRSNFAYLGGYSAAWNNYLLVELKNKKNDSILSSAIVYWKLAKPQLLNVYTTDDLSKIFHSIDNIYFDSTDQQQLQKFSEAYSKDEIDSTTKFPKKFTFSAGQNNLFFFLTATVFKKTAIEYRLKKDDKLISDWKQNDYDNHYIWLKNLLPGNYVLEVRYTRQRQSVSSFPFQIKPAFQQTIFFKIIIGLSALLFIGFIVTLLRLQHQKKLAQKHIKEKTEFELKAIRSQLNPHFIFNALNSIQSLINKNDIENANKYLSDFSVLMRTALQSSNNEMNVLSKELQLLNNYLQLEQLRFKFHYSITSNLNNDEIEIPSLLLQPIVENAVKHGVSSLQEKGAIDIRFTQSSNDILIAVVDNGKGFDTSKVYNGYGLKLTNERIKLINEKLNGQSINLAIDQSNGTTVHLILKNCLA